MLDDNRIPTNLRVLRILEAFAGAAGPMTASQINEQIGLPKQTIHRLITTMEAEGFLIRDPGGRHYRPSRRSRQMGAALWNASNQHVARHQILQSVAAEVGETVNFVIAEETGMRYSDRVETDWAFRIQLPVGSNVPFHCTASGKIFLSNLPKKQRDMMVAALPLERLTAQTITTTEGMKEELRKTRKRGYSIDDQEFMEGMVAIAVPVADPKGKFVAALAFHGPELRLTIADLVDRLPILQRGARALQHTLFEGE